MHTVMRRLSLLTIDLILMMGLTVVFILSLLLYPIKLLRKGLALSARWMTSRWVMV